MLKVTVSSDFNNQKLGRIITSLYNIPYSLLQKLFRTKKIKLNKSLATFNTIAVAGDIIDIYADIPSSRKPYIYEPKDEYLQQLMDMIIFENDDCLAINKPYNMPVQRGSRISFSIEDMIKSYTRYNCKLVHRLDKDTSGVLIIAKNLEAARKLSNAFQTGHAEKTYTAITDCIPEKKSGLIKVYLKKLMISNEEKIVISDDGTGIYSETYYEVINHNEKNATLLLQPKTGRKHQLRVHCAEFLQAPIVGDKKYGGTKSKYMYLHARKLQIPDLDLSVIADYPPYFNIDFKEHMC